MGANGTGGNGNPGSLSFWGERGDSPGDRAWKAWRRDLEALIAFLAERRAENAADEARLVEMKAAADAKVAEAEAEVARCEAEVERLEMDRNARDWRRNGGGLQ
jgi:hypothetical protein